VNKTNYTHSETWWWSN